MSRIARIFKKISDHFPPNSKNAMPAKEMQLMFLKTYLKPLLKQHGYSTNAQTWWRDRGDFFIVIHLQNFSWNSKHDVNFCFNIGIALKATMKGSDSTKAGYKDLTVHVRDESYLSDSRKTHKFHNNNGYIINATTNYDDFVKELKIDFEQEILPRLDKLKSIADCVDYYGDFPFWGDQLKRVLRDNGLIDEQI